MDKQSNSDNGQPPWKLLWITLTIVFVVAVITNELITWERIARLIDAFTK
jgi:hypothetical protein